MELNNELLKENHFVDVRENPELRDLLLEKWNNITLLRTSKSNINFICFGRDWGFMGDDGTYFRKHSRDYGTEILPEELIIDVSETYQIY